MPTFTETHKNPWRWYLVAYTVALPIIFYWAIHSNIRFVERRSYLLEMLGVYSLYAVYVMIKVFGNTTYQIDEQGVHYRVKPFEKRQTISWFHIDRAYVRDLTLFGEHPKGTVDARKRPKGRPYFMKFGSDSRVIDMKFGAKGDLGFQINKKTGDTILFGTHRPDELQAFLASLGFGA
ncbi:hypothetical protein [Spirosoma luteum]|uniref:hypothetical protein n=1 Tax=Spirosoma luteum TaxID=431553 RepID=UPI000375D466|nr:hypothetical protein [Spirosoma luteum]